MQHTGRGALWPRGSVPPRLLLGALSSQPACRSLNICKHLASWYMKQLRRGDVVALASRQLPPSCGEAHVVQACGGAVATDARWACGRARSSRRRAGRRRRTRRPPPPPPPRMMMTIRSPRPGRTRRRQRSGRRAGSAPLREIDRRTTTTTTTGPPPTPPRCLRRAFGTHATIPSSLPDDRTRRLGSGDSDQATRTRLLGSGDSDQVTRIR